MGNSNIVKIGDIAEVFDGPHATPKKIDVGPFFLSISSLENGQLDLSKSAHISDEQFEKWTRRVTPRFGDVLFSYETRLGEAALMPDGVKACLGRRMGLLRPQKNRVLPEYLLYAYLSPEFQQQIKRRTNHGATVERISLKELPDFEIRIPSIEEQRQVVQVIKAFPRKLEVNQQVNQTLEQMAQALFKSWFIDFDPVIDNALAAGNPIPDELAHRVEIRRKAQALPDFQPLPDHIRNLFPSEFEQTGEPTVGIDGWVPKGWSVMSLGDVTKELRRGISPKYTDEGGVQVVNQKCIRNHEVNYALSRRNDPTLRKVDGREIEIGDVLVNSTGVGTLGRLAQVNAVPEPTVVDSHVTVVRPNPQICPIYFFGQLMVSKERSIESLGEGSTGQTELSRRILAEQLVLVPPYEQAMLIEGQLKSLSDKSSLNLKQNSALAKLRDTLLPKLISGEINIKDTKECNG
ncbi:restriction endonuclease subunit S [Alteromonas australica]|uniref:Type I restriction modification DNA specificity domain-containing protein n=1 Tax=Alteromonas australica TaxID=589873 RepID=A0A075NWX8_9ALTE|nr:restriction endonuclease subunit S [Alteromonas australica]AIF97986.1 hypothetical protein EP13_04335 [Alteromonas australica]